MPEQEYEPDEFEDGMEDEGDDDGDDSPSTVFVSMPFGKDGAEEAFRMIAGVCDRLELDTQRLPKGGGQQALCEGIETSDFAIIDVSHKRLSLAEELNVADHEIHPSFILLIARTGSPRLPELENRTVHNYADPGDLRALIERHLNTMIDAWHEEGEQDDDEDDE